jgi:hypothetical protein
VRRVFADTFYWLALFVPGDAWAEAARVADVSDATSVTTKEVLFPLAAIAPGASRAGLPVKFSVTPVLRCWRFMSGAPTGGTARQTVFP